MSESDDENARVLFRGMSTPSLLVARGAYENDLRETHTGRGARERRAFLESRVRTILAVLRERGVVALT